MLVLGKYEECYREGGGVTPPLAIFPYTLLAIFASTRVWIVVRNTSTGEHLLDDELSNIFTCEATRVFYKLWCNVSVEVDVSKLLLLGIPQRLLHNVTASDLLMEVRTSEDREEGLFLRFLLFYTHAIFSLLILFFLLLPPPPPPQKKE